MLSSKDKCICLSERMWQKQELDRVLVWGSIVRLESSVAPSILTLSETGMTVPATLTDLRPDRDLHAVRPIRWSTRLERTTIVNVFRICCHSNETRAPIVNKANSAQLGGTPYHSPKLHLGLCTSLGMRQGTDRQTHADGCDHYTFRVVYDSHEM